MKKCILKIFLVLLIVFGVSCKDRTDIKEKEFLINSIKQLNITSQCKWIIVLPGLGCHGCIQEGEFFMKENITNTDILFVLTNISSLKIFQQKTNIKINDYPNIYIDRDNHFKLPTKNGIYPCIIQLSDGKLLNYSFQSPTSAAFFTLEKNKK